mmetsp:Transcript_19730/g.27734  ORF Transcript_19730/g.27734 Transcript_19730/m.27734 type:complete len:118 (+) Transcript_19730:464-817(+)
MKPQLVRAVSCIVAGHIFPLKRNILSLKAKDVIQPRKLEFHYPRRKPRPRVQQRCVNICYRKDNFLSPKDILVASQDRHSKTWVFKFHIDINKTQYIRKNFEHEQRQKSHSVNQFYI